MKLYYAPGACSLADHIALHEGQFDFEIEKVDLRTKKTKSGADFLAIAPKGYVPSLVLDSGEILSENIAILDWIANERPALCPAGPLARTRLVEALAFISTEVHKNFKPFFTGGGDKEKGEAAETIAARLAYLARTMKGDYLFGPEVGVADCYLFVMLLWADKNGVNSPDDLRRLFDRMIVRDAVKTAMTHEGLI